MEQYQKGGGAINVRMIFACLVLACSRNTLAGPALTLKLASHDYPPLIETSLPYGGVLTRIVAEVCREAGIDVHFEKVSNNRAIAGVMLGLYDGSYGWAHSAERDQKLYYSKKPIYTFHMVFFHRADQQYPWTTLSDLGKYRIGVTTGNFYSNEFASLQAAGKLTVDAADTDLSNFRKLVLGRIDLFPMEQQAGLYVLGQNFSSTDQKAITFQSKAMWTVPTYIVVRKTLPHAQEILDRFDQEFEKLSESGQIEKLADDAMTTILNQTKNKENVIGR